MPVVHYLNDTLQPDAYLELLPDWLVVIADVQNSTQAIQQGRYRDINTVGGSTISAVLNAVKPFKIPYVFGGDGASFCVPPEFIEAVEKALKGCQEMASKGLNLDLRVGIVPYSDLTRSILLCRYQSTPSLTQYFFMGGGMEEADDKVKQQTVYHLSKTIEPDADFSGFECRWNEVPSAQEVTFSLLVKARTENQQDALVLYQALHQHLIDLLGEVLSHHPLSEQGLSLSFKPSKLKGESVIKSFQNAKGISWVTRWIMTVKLLFQNVVGRYWMRFNKHEIGADWGRYKSDLVMNSDYLKLDDTYRTVMSGTYKTVSELLSWLESEYQKGHLFYGYHQTHSAVVTCLVAKTGIEHIHFVDSAEGGYAMAAKQLKKQVQQAS
ncbi:DUF3095 family protein [Hydrogenovibrio sp. 3SP14C1]|nr:DUF3095 family protein [Hydrogenovibrio sp. 3SP14C1]MDG4811632.1 DUF3095 family protein [Hydrogenovibrio sp. 3SP14C1]